MEVQRIKCCFYNLPSSECIYKEEEKYKALGKIALVWQFLSVVHQISFIARKREIFTFENNNALHRRQR